MLTSISTFDQLQLRGLWVVDTDTNSVLFTARFGTHTERQHYVGAQLTGIQDAAIVSSVLNDMRLKMSDLTATSMADYRASLGLREQRQLQDFRRHQADGDGGGNGYSPEGDAFLESLLDRVGSSSDVEGGVSFFDACARRIRAERAGFHPYEVPSTSSKGQSDPSLVGDESRSVNRSASPSSPQSPTVNAQSPAAGVRFQPSMLKAGGHLFSRAFMSPNICEIVAVERDVARQLHTIPPLKGNQSGLVEDGCVDELGESTSNNQQSVRPELVDVGPFVVLSGKRATITSATAEDIFNATGLKPRARVDPNLFSMTLDDDDGEDDAGAMEEAGHDDDDNHVMRNRSFAGLASEIASRAKSRGAGSAASRAASQQLPNKRNPHIRRQEATKKLLTRFENHPTHDPLENIVIIVAPLIRGPMLNGADVEDTSTPTVPFPQSSTKLRTDPTGVSVENSAVAAARRFLAPTLLRCFYFMRRWLMPFVEDTLLLRITLSHAPGRKQTSSPKSMMGKSASTTNLPSASIDPSREFLDELVDEDAANLLTEATNAAASMLSGYQITCARRVVTLVGWSRAFSAFLGEALQRGMPRPILQAAVFHSIGFGSHSGGPAPIERAHSLRHLVDKSLLPENTIDAMVGIVERVAGYRRLSVTGGPNPSQQTTASQPLSKPSSEPDLAGSIGRASPSSLSRRTLLRAGKQSGAQLSGVRQDPVSVELVRAAACRQAITALDICTRGTVPILVPVSPKVLSSSSSQTSYRSGTVTSPNTTTTGDAKVPLRSDAIANVVASLSPTALYRAFESAGIELGVQPEHSMGRNGAVDVSRTTSVLPSATSFATMTMCKQIAQSTAQPTNTNDIEASIAAAAKRQLHIYTEELVAGNFYGSSEHDHLRVTTRILAEPPSHGFTPTLVKALADLKALGGGRSMPALRRRLVQGNPSEVATAVTPLPPGLEDVTDISVCLIGGVGPNQQKDLVQPFAWSCEALLGASSLGISSSLFPAGSRRNTKPDLSDTVLLTDTGVVSAALNSLLSHPLPTPLNAALVATADGVKDLASGTRTASRSYNGQSSKSANAAAALSKYVSSGDWMHPATLATLPDPIDQLHLPARYSVLTSQTSFPPMALLACDRAFEVLHARSLQASTALAAGVDFENDVQSATPGTRLPLSLFSRQQGGASTFVSSSVVGESAADRYDASTSRKSMMPTAQATRTSSATAISSRGEFTEGLDVREASTATLEPLVLAAYKRDICIDAARTPLRNGSVSYGFKGGYSLVPVLDSVQLRALLATTDFSEGMCPQSRGEVRKHSKDEAQANHDWVENLLDMQGHVCYQLELELSLDIATVPTADVGRLEVVVQLFDGVSILFYQCTSTMRPPGGGAGGGATGGMHPFGFPLVSSTITQLSGGDKMLWSIGGGLLEVKSGTSFFLRGIVVADVSSRPEAARLPKFSVRDNCDVHGGFNDSFSDDGGIDDLEGGDTYHSQFPGHKAVDHATKNVTEEEILAAVTVYSSASVHFTLLVERPFLPGSVLAVHPFIVAKHLLDTRAPVGKAPPASPTAPSSRYEDSIPKDVEEIHQMLRSLSFAGSGMPTSNAIINSIFRVGLPSRAHVKYRESEAVWANSCCTQPHPITAAVVVRSDPEAGFTLWNYGGNTN